MRTKREPTAKRGFTILEVLISLAVFLVLGGISLIYWDSYYPVFALDQAAQQLQMDLEMCRFRSIFRQNQWVVEVVDRDVLSTTTKAFPVRNRHGHVIPGRMFTVSVNSHCIWNDDGWLGSGHRAYYPGSPNYLEALRSNTEMNQHEWEKGPVVLGRGLSFLPVNNANSRFTVNRVVFRHLAPRIRCYHSNAGGTYDPVDSPGNWNIMIRNQHYVNGDTSEDNMVHLRTLRILPSGLVRLTHG